MSDHDDSFIAEALPAFISEAAEQTAMLEQLLLQLEDDPGDRELLDALFRCAHTVKGSAGLFGLGRVVDFTHHVETLLDLLREGRVALTPAIGTLLLRCNDQVRRLVGEAHAPGGADGDAVLRAELVAELAAAGGSAVAAAAPAPCAEPAGAEAGQRWKVGARFGADTYRNGLDPLAMLDYLRAAGDVAALQCDAGAVPPLEEADVESCALGFSFEFAGAGAREAIESAFSFALDDCALSVEPVVTKVTEVNEVNEVTAIAASPAPTPATPAGRRDGAGADTRLIRVQADRLDAVINLLGELVIASAGASLVARQTRQSALIEANQQIATLVEDIRNATLQLRMVPIGETFTRFRRVVRDTAAELGKDVALEIVGADTELDKSVVERIADPLMHLVRNALDHGLETAAEREAAGKPAQGRLTLAASHEAGGILIRIVDDGRGIQRQKVLERAWSRGLLEPGTVPPDDELFELIFEPGFSTAEKVTNLSGRGVGMDVVRRNIEALRGHVVITSNEGQGSAIEIRLPLTLAIIDGFLVGVGASRFIFPLDAVVEVIEDRPTAAATDARGRGMVELRGRVLPLLGLRAHYELASPPPARSSIVVIQSGTHRCGVLVDQLLGQHQTVIKPLGRLFRSLRGISGSSVLGNGDVALIFDVTSLVQHATEPLHRRHLELNEGTQP